MSTPIISPETRFAAAGAELAKVVNEVELDLRKITDAGRRPAPKQWSPKDVIGHLVDSATNNHQRFVRGALQKGGAFPDYDGAGWVEMQQPRSAEWALLISLWAHYNRYLAHVLGLMPAEAESYSVTIGDSKPMTLLFVAQDYVEHLKHHLNQIFGARYETRYK